MARTRNATAWRFALQVWTELGLRRSLARVRQLGPGDEIAGYRIEAIAGRGGMGLVYRARQRRPDRTVAIKVIAPELAADPGFRARFEQESATMTGCCSAR